MVPVRHPTKGESITPDHEKHLSQVSSMVCDVYILSFKKNHPKQLPNALSSTYGYYINSSPAHLMMMPVLIANAWQGGINP